MLTFGGGLAVIGLIVWLVSLGLFRHSAAMAVAMGLATLLLLGLGWFVTLRTRFHVAGVALTFLGCVVAPLNLWFYHAQGLMTIDGHLWLGGVACCLLYAATVVVLRRPVFLYAVECGITLTMLLLLADMGRVTDVVFLSLFLMGLGLISMHAERAFSPDRETHFNQDRYGQPLFWSGHAQIVGSLTILAFVQVLYVAGNPLDDGFSSRLADNLLVRGRWLPCGMWLAGAYAYLYSHIVARRMPTGVYNSAFCLIMAEVSLMIGFELHSEWLIILLAVTALAANVIQLRLSGHTPNGRDDVSTTVPVVGFVLSAIPVVLGAVLHLRATSSLMAWAGWEYQTGWPFAFAMAVCVACNRYCAWLFRHVAPRWSAVCYFLYAAAVIVGAAGLLRACGITAWIHQSPLLMLIPIAYIAASRFWRGHSPERPLGWIAHASTAVILLHVVFASLRELSTLAPVEGEVGNLYLGLVFAESAVFYGLAGFFRRRSANAFFASASAMGALWQLLGYFAVPGIWQTAIYAGLGLSLLALARGLGLEHVMVYRAAGEKAQVIRGRGLTTFQCGNGILMITLLSGLLKGLSRLLNTGLDWSELISPLIACGSALAAIPLVPQGLWRRLYFTAAIALAGLTLLTLNVLIDLSGWQKFEMFCVVFGIALLIAGHVGMFSSENVTEGHDETVGMGLWVGSLLTALPLFVAFNFHRFFGAGPSLTDEFALLTVTILMVITGVSWQTKATTIIGGLTLVLYLMILITSLAYRPQVAVGVYLAVGGILIFAAGVLLSIYRDRLLALPDRIANREGLFGILNWR